VIIGETLAGARSRAGLTITDVSARYLLVWFTLLPPDDNGTYQAYVSAVTVTVTS
jgi:hypothetical protein